MSPRSPRAVIPLLCTVAVIGFLWVAPAALYGNALWQVARYAPGRWVEALPLRPLPRVLFLNTLILGSLTSVLSLCFGLPVAVLLARAARPLRMVGAILCALPLAIPPTLGASAFLEITRTPPARSMAALAADRPMPVTPLVVTSFVLALCFYPIVAFAVAAALRSLPAAQEEAARLFGDSRQAWRRVIWPQIAPAAWGATGLVAALAMWEMGAADLLDARTYSVQIYRELSAPDDLDPQGKAIKAALAGVPMLLLGALSLWPAMRALTHYKPGQQTGTLDRVTPRPLHFAIPWLAALIFAASPLATLGIFVSQLKPPRVLFEVWSGNDREIYNTLLTATTGTILVVATALMLAMCWRDWPARWQKWALGLTVWPLLIAPMLLGVALIAFWNRPAFSLIYGGIEPTGYVLADWIAATSSRYAMMVIGYLSRFLPAAILLLFEAARRVEPSLLEAAANVGATPRRTRLTILLPLLGPAWLGVASLVWAWCASELATSVLVNAPGGQTLPVPIFNFMHIGSTAEVAALSLTLFGMSALALLGLSGFALVLLRHRRSGNDRAVIECEET